MDPLAIALEGLLFSPLHVALQGFVVDDGGDPEPGAAFYCVSDNEES